MDCHNRATHIYQRPEELVDEALASGAIDPSVPAIKRTALAALTGNYASVGGAMQGIERDLHGYYLRHHQADYPNLAPRLDEAVELLQAAHRRNVHPRMNVGWEPYPDHIGHVGDTGCARCHHRDMVDSEGVAVSHECTQCHHILAWDSPDPFRFLQPLDEDDPDLELHRSLQAEFVGAVPRLLDEGEEVVEDPYLPWNPAGDGNSAVPSPFEPTEPVPTWATP